MEIKCFFYMVLWVFRFSDRFSSDCLTWHFLFFCNCGFVFFFLLIFEIYTFKVKAKASGHAYEIWSKCYEIYFCNHTLKRQRKKHFFSLRFQNMVTENKFHTTCFKFCKPHFFVESDTLGACSIVIVSSYKEFMTSASNFSSLNKNLKYANTTDNPSQNNLTLLHLLT